MKRKLFTILLGVVMMFSAVAFAACGSDVVECPNPADHDNVCENPADHDNVCPDPNAHKALTEATAYAYVHGGYVGIATVKKDTTKASGYATTIEELMLPQNWANTSVDGAAQARLAGVEFGGQKWTLDATAGSNANGWYKKDGNWLGEWVKIPANAKVYAVAALAGNFYALDASGNRIDDAKVAYFKNGAGGAITEGRLTKIDSLKKSKNGYWASGNATHPAVTDFANLSKTAWNGNINGMIAYLNQYGFGFAPKGIVQATGEVYKVNGVAMAGVTATDTRDYMMLAFTAYSILVA